MVIVFVGVLLIKDQMLMGMREHMTFQCEAVLKQSHMAEGKLFVFLILKRSLTFFNYHLFPPGEISLCFLSQ